METPAVLLGGCRCNLDVLIRRVTTMEVAMEERSGEGEAHVAVVLPQARAPGAASSWEKRAAGSPLGCVLRPGPATPDLSPGELQHTSGLLLGQNRFPWT